VQVPLRLLTACGLYSGAQAQCVVSCIHDSIVRHLEDYPCYTRGMSGSKNVLFLSSSVIGRQKLLEFFYS